MQRIYLAGPVTGITYENSSSWRAAVRNLFGHISAGQLCLLDPLRHQTHMPHSVPLSALGREHTTATGLASANAVRARNRNDVRMVDLVLVNLLGAERVSLGTVMEIAWADLLDIPTVFVMEPAGNVHEHIMLTPGIEYRFDNLREAATACLSILGLKID